MVVILLNAFIFYLIKYPNPVFGLSRFNLYGNPGAAGKIKSLIIKTLKPFITHDLSNQILFFFLINSIYLSFEFVQLPDTSYTGLIKNFLYASLSASIFALFISTVPNEKRKIHQARRVKIEFIPFIERDNIVRAELDYWDNMFADNKFLQNKRETLETKILKAQHNQQKTKKEHNVTSLHEHGLTIYQEQTNIYDIMLSLINDDITFILRMKECDISLFPEIYNSLQELESQLVWLKNTVTGKVTTDPTYRDKAIAQSLCTCIGKKQQLLQMYSQTIRNYCDDAHDNIADIIRPKTNKDMLIHIYDRIKILYLNIESTIKLFLTKN